MHDLGGQRFLFVVFHTLDLQKALEEEPWIFKQSLLVFHRLKEGVDPHLVPLNKWKFGKSA